MSNYFTLIKADYLQRTRNYTFLVTLIVSVYFAYTLVPAVGANYQTVRVGDYIGQQNSAWIGHVTAAMASVFSWIIGFYLINNGIKRDIATGVGQIIATTGTSNFKYLLTKVLSNFLVLLSIMSIIMVMGLGLYVVRGRTYPFDAVQFFFPFFFSALPSIFIVSVVAVIAEVFLGRFQNLQNIGFFCLVMVLLGPNSNHGGSTHVFFDVFGVQYLTNSIAHVVNVSHSQTGLSASVGFQIGRKTDHIFLFSGSVWSSLFVLSRLIWVAFSMILLYISSLFFHRFDLGPAGNIKTRKIKKGERQNEAGTEALIPLGEGNYPAPAMRLSELPKAKTDLSILPFLRTEILMLLRKGPRWFWIGNIGLFTALFFIPLPLAHKFGLPVIWFLQINRWADIATKEKQYSTHYFTYAAYRPLQRLLSSQLLAGILLALILAAPVIIRYVWNGEFMTVATIVIAAVFLMASSVAIGIVTGSDRLFNILFFMLSYANLNVIPALDYYGAVNSGTGYITIMLSLTMALLIIAYLWRSFEIRNQ